MQKIRINKICLLIVCEYKDIDTIARRAPRYAEFKPSRLQYGSSKMTKLIGQTIAIRMPIGKSDLVVTGFIEPSVDLEQEMDLRIKLHCPNGSSGSPVIVLEKKYRQNLQQDSEFGCEYFLSLAEFDPTNPDSLCQTTQC